MISSLLVYLNSNISLKAINAIRDNHRFIDRCFLPIFLKDRTKTGNRISDGSACSLIQILPSGSTPLFTFSAFVNEIARNDQYQSQEFVILQARES